MSPICFKRPTLLLCASAIAIASFATFPAQAGMIGTDAVVAETQATGARSTISSFMARDDVRSEFARLGVDPEEAESRIAALSDEEAAQLAANIEQAPAGEGALGAIIGAGVLIFLVLLITDILGLTDVFGFTNKGSVS